MTEPMAAMRKFTSLRAIGTIWVGLLVGLGGAISLFSDMIRAGGRDVLWADEFDSRLIYWIVNWGYHILFEARQPLNFWNANSFYPNSMTLAYSDSLLSIQLLFAPLRMLGVPPLASLYLTLAGFCVIGATLTYYALGRIGGLSIAERALVSFAAHFSLSVTSFLIHYQLFGFQLAPPFFLYLFLFLRDLQSKYIIWAAVLYAVGMGFAMYLAPMLLVLSVFMSISMLVKQIRSVGFTAPLRKIGLPGIGILVLIFLIVYFVQVKPYLQISADFPKQSFEETATYSANFTSLLDDISIFSLLHGPPGYGTYGAWEYAFFPGYLLIACGALYFPLLVVSNIRQRLFASGIANPINLPSKLTTPSAQRISSDLILFMVILFAGAIILSWGPLNKLDHSVKLPFYYLADLFPGLREVRAPGRFGMFVGMPLGLLTVAFLRHAFTDARKRRWVSLLALTLLVAESLPKFPVTPFSVDQDGVYKSVSRAIKPGTPLLELPVVGKDHFDTLKVAMAQLDGSTIHWGRLVVGYGSNKSSPQYSQLLYLDSQITQNAKNYEQLFAFGKQHGISYYLVRLNRYAPPISQQWRERVKDVGARVVFEDSNTIFFELDDTP